MTQPDFDQGALERWLEAHAPEISGIASIGKFPGGQSNPTYRLSSPAGNYVLRRKPFGPLLPSAHAVDREFQLISALYPTGFPVARPIALCSDPAVIGAEFYLMEMVVGRTLWNGALPDQTPPERSGIYEAIVDTLARLHGIDVQAVGLGDFGKPGNFFARQVDRWTKQYRKSQTDDIPAVERLIEWLPTRIPPQARNCIVHGDYRIDNLIFAGGSPQVLAVLDWELATIGDPLADLSYFALNWLLPADGGAGLRGLDLTGTGIPALEEIVDRYQSATGMSGMLDLDWYFAFGLFRIVGIFQGIKQRMLDGNASSATASKYAALVEPFARMAWDFAEHAQAKSK